MIAQYKEYERWIVGIEQKLQIQIITTGDSAEKAMCMTSLDKFPKEVLGQGWLIL